MEPEVVVTPEVAPEVTPEVTTEETIEEVRAKLAKAEEIAVNQRIRAEKAEKARKVEPPVVEKKSGDLSSSDTIAIMRANVHEDDVAEVVDIAKLKGISVSEALKLDITKATLNLKGEQRGSAAAANTGAGRRGSSAVSDEALSSNASSGKNIPEDDAEIARLMAIRSKQGRK